MNEVLEKVTKEWMELERSTQEQRTKANEFYEKQVFPFVVEDYMERNRDSLRNEKTDYLIVTVGTSYEPIVLNISLFKPERILFLCTKQSYEYLDKIVTYCSLKPTNYLIKIVDGDNPIDVYKEIKNAYVEWGNPEKLFVDFTGGTKAMSGAAAMAGAMIQMQLVYVGNSEYLVQYRKPRPGTEFLIYIPNPIQIFGDLEIKKAVAVFKEENYSGAKVKFKELSIEIPDPEIRQQMEFLFLLMKVYEEWDALDFTEATKSMEELCRGLKRDKDTHSDYVLVNCFERLCRQKELLSRMAEIPDMILNGENMKVLSEKVYMFPLMFTLFLGALRRERQSKFDMATLLLYRVLELIEQRRLSLYNIFVSDANYDDIKAFDEAKVWIDNRLLVDNERIDPERLKSEANIIYHKVFGGEADVNLGEKIALLNGFIILAVLNDPIIANKKGGRLIDKIKRLRAMVELRDNGIFAHGMAPVSEDRYRKFKKYVTELVEDLCVIEKEDFDDYKSKFEFLRTEEIGNIGSLGI